MNDVMDGEEVQDQQGSKMNESNRKSPKNKIKGIKV